MYFPRNWEFGLAFLKLRNFGRVGFEPLTPLGTPLKNNGVFKTGNPDV
jgi:hypothetical protein